MKFLMPRYISRSVMVVAVRMTGLNVPDFMSTWLKDRWTYGSEVLKYSTNSLSYPGLFSSVTKSGCSLIPIAMLASVFVFGSPAMYRPSMLRQRALSANF